MANNNFSMALLFISIFLRFLLTNCQTTPLAPAMYIFGDSVEDSGNNNFLQTTAKVNFTPYGIDFPQGKATGRFGNGKTNVDIIAQFLGIPLVPPYLGLSEVEKKNLTTGVNYASGGGGILRETGSATGTVLSFDKQIEYFRQTITDDLLPIFGKISALKNYLSKSIFWVALGNNDYINNYLQPAYYPSSRIYTPQEFADRLIRHLRIRLTLLYLLGARKFVVYNIGRIGCTPAIVNTTTPRPITPCAESINDLVMLYNNKFPAMITNLQASLPRATFVSGDAYTVGRTSAEIGITTQQIPCCQDISSSTGLCVPNSTVCADRNALFFWDAFHTTEIVNFVGANDCFSGNSSCVPINVQQLAQKP